MKKELILTERNASYNELSRFFTDVAAWFQTPVEWLRNYYSSVLEREVSSKQAQLALILTIFPIVSSLLLQGVFLIWFVFSLYKCKKG